MLNIKDLKAGIETVDGDILNGVDLTVGTGEIHALMGQNGSGKSTLAQTLMGNPMYQVSAGKVTFNQADLLTLEPDERARAGLFLSFQYPSEITGVTISNFLRMIYGLTHTKLSPIKFRELLHRKMDMLKMDYAFADRYLNDGFSGGEKKRMEMLQMLVLEPKLVILDEVDSGLDVDALKIVASAVNSLKETNPDTSVLIITHYQRILDYIVPDKVHVMSKGKIVKSGDAELAKTLEQEGYAGL